MNSEIHVDTKSVDINTSLYILDSRIVLWYIIMTQLF